MRNAGRAVLVLVAAASLGLVPAATAGKTKKIPVKVVIADYSDISGATVLLESNSAKCLKNRLITVSSEENSIEYETDSQGIVEIPHEDVRDAFGLASLEITVPRSKKFGSSNRPKQCKADTARLQIDMTPVSVSLDYDPSGMFFFGAVDSELSACESERTVLVGYIENEEVILDGQTSADADGNFVYSPNTPGPGPWIAGVTAVLNNVQLAQSGDATLDYCAYAQSDPVSTR